jgi:predicted MPP superfamily phosphohydrolase
LKLIKDFDFLASLKPDLVVSTGDFLGALDSIDILIEMLGALLTLPGYFVLGSNDYFGPTLRNPFSYLKKRPVELKFGKKIDTERLICELSNHGWVYLDCLKIQTEIRGVNVELRGTGDAHINKDEYTKVKGVKNKESDVSIGLTHAPYKKLLNEMAADGLDLILAGHTHGGQVRFPWFTGSKAIVTNCDLPNWRSRGLTKLPNEPYLNVSAGIGSSKSLPIRILCPPEASLIKLTSLNES